MDDVTLDPDMHERIESAGPPSGDPGARLRAASQGVGSDPLPPLKPGSIGVRYRLRSRFRTSDAFACVPTYLAQTRGCDTLVGRDGERLHGGQAYTPVLVGGARVEASNENLDAIIRRAVPDEVVHARHPAIAERELFAAMHPALDRYLLIDGEIWIRLSGDSVGSDCR